MIPFAEMDAAGGSWLTDDYYKAVSCLDCRTEFVFTAIAWCEGMPTELSRWPAEFECPNCHRVWPIVQRSANGSPR